MKKIKKAILLAMCLVMLLPANVLAAGNVTLFISNPAPKVGDNFIVTIKATESAQIKISYNSQIIEIAGADVTGTSTSNSLTFTGQEAKITFKAKTEGTSGVIVESPSLTGASFNVPISGGSGNQTETPPANPEPTPEPEPEPEPEPTEQTTPNPAPTDGSDFVVDGEGFVLSERYRDNEIPAGFTETRLEINGKRVRELTNGVIVLVYLKPTNNIEGSGEFYVYSSEEGTVSKMVMLGTADDYVILDTPTTFFTETLKEAELNTGEKVVSAYHIENSESEFYYVYGSNAQGTFGWYAYDSLTGRVSRADIMSLALIDYNKPAESIPPESEAKDEPEASKQSFIDKISDKINELGEKIGLDLSTINTKLILIVVAVIMALIILIIIISAIMRNRDDYYDDDFYDDGDDEEEIPKSESTNISPGNSGPVTEVLNPEDNLIDDLINKASAREGNTNNEDVDIINLDDL